MSILLSIPWGGIPVWVIMIGIILLVILIVFAFRLMWDFAEDISVIVADRQGRFLIRRNLPAIRG
jgi:hypothetical protein